MTVRHYSSLDTGAPALSYLAGARLIDNLKTIVMACLVTGYASKPGAGWTVRHEHANGFSLGSSDGIINFVYASIADSLDLYIMEAVTDGSTALASGTNRRSGEWFDGSSATTRHGLYCPALTGSAPNKYWSVVADERTVTLLIGSGSVVDEPSGAQALCLHFGTYTSALNLAGFCCLGGHAAFRSQALLMQGFHGTVLRSPFTGLVEQGLAPRHGALPAVVGGPLGGISRTKIKQLRVTLPRVDIYGYGVGVSGVANASGFVWCGRLRGLVVDPTLASCPLSQVLTALGVVSPVWQDRVRPLSLSGLTTLVPLYSSNYDLGAFVSLDPADWA